MLQNSLIGKDKEGLPLSFSDSYTKNEYQLFEVPNAELLETILNGTQTAVIKKYLAPTGIDA